MALEFSDQPDGQATVDHIHDIARFVVATSARSRVGDVLTVKRGVVVWVSVAVAVVAGVHFYFVFAGSSSPTAPVAESPTSAVAVPFSAHDAARLNADMTSGDEQRVRAALAVPDDQTLDPGAVVDLAAVGPVRFDHSTFHDLGGGRAEVIANTATGTWVVALVVVKKEWRIESTRAEP